jgi:hypothetical protein
MAYVVVSTEGMLSFHFLARACAYCFACMSLGVLWFVCVLPLGGLSVLFFLFLKELKRG